MAKRYQHTDAVDGPVLYGTDTAIRTIENGLLIYEVDPANDALYTTGLGWQASKALAIANFYASIGVPTPSAVTFEASDTATVLGANVKNGTKVILITGATSIAFEADKMPEGVYEVFNSTGATCTFSQTGATAVALPASILTNVKTTITIARNSAGTLFIG